MEGVREYGEQEAVNLSEHKGRPTIVAWNEAGYNNTEVDLRDVIDWVKRHRPELLL